MKVEMSTKLEKLKHYEFLVDEYKRALDDEIKKSNNYKQLINQKSQGFSFSIGSNK